MTVSRKSLENEFGKEEPNIEELEKELKVAEQLAAEVVELTDVQRQFLEMHNQQQRLNVLNTGQMKLQEDCKLLSNVSCFLERPPPIDFGDEADASPKEQFLFAKAVSVSELEYCSQYRNTFSTSCKKKRRRKVEEVECEYASPKTYA